MAKTTTNGLRQKPLQSQNQPGDVMDVDTDPFNLPPSTLAAQLVNNITSIRRPSYRTPSDSFSTLVFEIKKFEDLPEESKVGEPLILHDRRTVYVLTIAILDKLSSTSSDPFAEPDQAGLAIDALVTAITATPVILVREAEEGDLVDTGRGIPLWLWLWPRLLRLVGKHGTDALWDKIAGFFKAAFEAVKGQQSEFWGLERKWLAYLRHCADAALHHIEHTKVAKLPLDSIGDDIAFQYGENILKERCSYELKGGADAFHQADILFMVFSELFCSPAPVVAKSEDINELNAHALWIFESFLELRIKAVTAGVYTDQQEEVKTCSTSINTVHRILIALERQLTDAVKRKGYRVLTHLIDELISYKSPFREAVSIMDLCSILVDLSAVCNQSTSLSRFVSMRLLPGLRHVVISMQEESQRAGGEQSTEILDLLKCFVLLEQRCQSAQAFDIGSLKTDRHISHDTLSKQLHSLNLEIEEQEPVDKEQRRSKRQKVETLPKSLMMQIIEKMDGYLQLQNATNDDELCQIATGNFLKLTESRKCEVIELLGCIPCSAARTLTVQWDRARMIDDSECTVCDLGEEYVATEDTTNSLQDMGGRVVTVLAGIIKTPEFERSQKPRILAMITLRKFALHFDIPRLVDLEQSELAKWCFSSLKSKMRELRITAGRTLPAFLRDSDDALMSQRNRVLALDGLKQISEGCPTHLIETLVLAWGQIAAVSKNRELNFALLRLVEYLGHSFEVVVAAASNEILNTAEAHGVSVQQLFSPFWSTIAYVAVKDLQKRPQLTQSMADLLEMTIPDLLVNTQIHAVPWLVLENGRDVLARISQARGDADEGQVIVDNLAIIMSRLLTQNKPDIEEYIIEVIQSYSLRFDSNEFTVYLRSAAVMIAADLLKQAGEESENNPSRVGLNFNHPVLVLTHFEGKTCTQLPRKSMYQPKCFKKQETSDRHLPRAAWPWNHVTFLRCTQ